METAVRVPPSIEVAMTEIDNLSAGVAQLLLIVGRLEEGQKQQDQRTAVFWSKDWPHVIDAIGKLDARMDVIERNAHSAHALAAIFRWGFAATVSVLGVSTAFLAIYH